MNAEDLKARTKKFALDVACLCADIPHVTETTHVRGQLQPSPRVAKGEAGRAGVRRTKAGSTRWTCSGLAGQRCSSSVAANYRAACRGKSRADFVSKLGIVEEEADESAFWLEFLKDLDARRDLHFGEQVSNELDRLWDEANQLLHAGRITGTVCNRKCTSRFRLK